MSNRPSINLQAVSIAVARSRMTSEERLAQPLSFPDAVVLALASTNADWKARGQHQLLDLAASAPEEGGESIRAQVRHIFGSQLRPDEIPLRIKERFVALFPPSIEDLWAMISLDEDDAGAQARCLFSLIDIARKQPDGQSGVLWANIGTYVLETANQHVRNYPGLLEDLACWLPFKVMQRTAKKMLDQRNRPSEPEGIAKAA